MPKKPEFIDFKGFLSFLILHELKKQPLYGDQLAHLIGERRGNKLTPGTIYPALKQLREHELITYEQDGRLKIYSLTAAGKKELQALYKQFSRYFQGLEKRIKPVKTPRQTAQRKRGVTRR